MMKPIAKKAPAERAVKNILRAKRIGPVLSRYHVDTTALTVGDLFSHLRRLENCHMVAPMVEVQSHLRPATCTACDNQHSVCLVCHNLTGVE